MLIHAFRRKSASTHEFGGKLYKFTPNEDGHCVCDVADDAAAARFLSIKDAFRPYGEDAEALAAKSDASGGKPGFVLTNGDASVDLGAMSDAELKQFAKDQNLQVDGRLKGDKLREAIHAAITDDDEA